LPSSHKTERRNEGTFKLSRSVNEWLRTLWTGDTSFGACPPPISLFVWANAPAVFLKGKAFLLGRQMQHNVQNLPIAGGNLPAFWNPTRPCGLALAPNVCFTPMPAAWLAMEMPCAYEEPDSRWRSGVWGFYAGPPHTTRRRKATKQPPGTPTVPPACVLHLKAKVHYGPFCLTATFT